MAIGDSIADLSSTLVLDQLMRFLVVYVLFLHECPVFIIFFISQYGKLVKRDKNNCSYSQIVFKDNFLYPK